MPLKIILSFLTCEVLNILTRLGLILTIVWLVISCRTRHIVWWHLATWTIVHMVGPHWGWHHLLTVTCKISHIFKSGLYNRNAFILQENKSYLSLPRECQDLHYKQRLYLQSALYLLLAFVKHPKNFQLLNKHFNCTNFNYTFFYLQIQHSIHYTNLELPWVIGSCEYFVHLFVVMKNEAALDSQQHYLKKEINLYISVLCISRNFKYFLTLMTKLKTY